jgi:hypothetical protein
VLGPSNSDVLRIMATEHVACTAVGGIYSSQSTADSARCKIKYNKISGIPIDFAIGTDRDLAKALSRELHVRDCCTANPENQIAIIAEWDTLYGRDIIDVFEEVFKTCVVPGATERPKVKGERKNIHAFTYFQGIDGRLPTDKRTESSDAKHDQESTIWKEPLPGRPGTSVPAVGYPRIDYLRRAVEELKRKNSAWRAIGIVGSDVYDKILLIRVLRYYFPGAILFTTDLDARLLDPAEYPSTHNLVIASHYGLELCGELQREVPPFRSVYQTSEYFATIRAIQETRCGSGTMKAAAIEMDVQTDGKPRTISLEPIPVVFEVGRTGPFPLDFRRAVDDTSLPIAETAHPDDFERTFWPFSSTDRSKVWLLGSAVVLGLVLSALVYLCYRSPISSSGPWKRLLGWCMLAVVIWTAAGLAVIAYDPSVMTSFHGFWIAELVVLVPLLFIVACVSYRSLEDSNGDFTFWLVWIVGLGIASAGLLGLAIRFHLDPGGEPLRLFDGISVWPSEFLRLFALFFAMGALVHGFRQLRNSEEQAKGWFDKKSTFWDSVHQGFHAWHRSSRIAVLAALYTVFALSLSSLMDKPDRPVRGEFCDATDHVLLGLGVVATVSLLFFVVDATLVTDRLVRKLRSIEFKQWEVGKLHRTAASLGFAKDKDKKYSPSANRTSGHVLGLKLTAELTSDVGTLIYYPAVALVLMFLSRSRTFDNWDWPPILLIIFGVASSAVVACGISLRVTADRARQHMTEELEDELSEARQHADGNTEDQVTESVQAAIDEIKAIDVGAYSSLYSNPVIRAVLIPLAGLAGLVPLIGKALGVEP